MKMEIYNAVIRLGGSLHNEVAKRGLTVPEILIMRRLHGTDGVVKLEHVGYADMDGLIERERLQFEYNEGLAALAEDDKTSVEKMFGSEYQALPDKLRDYSGAYSKREDELEEFQAPLPYASPAHDGKQQRKEGRVAKMPEIPTGKGGKSALAAAS